MSEREPVHLEAEQALQDHVNKRIREIEERIHSSIGRVLTKEELKQFKEDIWEVNDCIQWFCGEEDVVYEDFAYQYELKDGRLHIWQNKDENIQG